MKRTYSTAFPQIDLTSSTTASLLNNLDESNPNARERLPMASLLQEPVEPMDVSQLSNKYERTIVKEVDLAMSTLQDPMPLLRKSPPEIKPDFIILHYDWSNTFEFYLDGSKLNSILNMDAILNYKIGKEGLFIYVQRVRRRLPPSMQSPLGKHSNPLPKPQSHHHHHPPPAIPSAVPTLPSLPLPPPPQPQPPSTMTPTPSFQLLRPPKVEPMPYQVTVGLAATDLNID